MLYSFLCATNFSARMKMLWSNTYTLTLKSSMAALKTTVGSASLDGAEDRQKRGVLAHRHIVRTMEDVVHASTECDVVLQGAIPFYAFAH